MDSLNPYGSLGKGFFDALMLVNDEGVGFYDRRLVASLLIARLQKLRAAQSFRPSE